MNSNQNDKKAKLSMLKSAIYNMADLPKKMIKYATPIALLLIISGTVFFIINRMSNSYSSIFDKTATSFIINSFYVLCEFLIAAFVIDIVIKRKT
ncbi:hypothetical protein [Ruminiclostridium cellulolyticum]|uniref:Uncharacterized protein n=1 Tax=Ruminiclostridium cellulolyticum (strain ATCC 35319 / DSM 5812 / JCM 6584 / H10) TaxID=394503 RepID=B8I6M8_RUMCH|nr:hypothetical protein [Ruminiclostridium cellulolyticum]ACL74920.1 hypothetical protein Ccel_0538 [Ruminiclostridium cellulolyticum H10]